MKNFLIASGLKLVPFTVNESIRVNICNGEENIHMNMIK